METTEIRRTIAFMLINDEAMELSLKLQKTIYVIYRNNGLINSLSKENGVILSYWTMGNETIMN
jgi:hypothetical protein